MALLVSRGLINKISKMEDVSFGSIWFKLADFGIEFELELKYLEIYATTISKEDGEIRAKVMDQIQKHFNPQIKTKFEELLENFNKQFSKDKNPYMQIRTQAKQSIMGQKK